MRKFFLILTAITFGLQLYAQDRTAGTTQDKFPFNIPNRDDIEQIDRNVLYNKVVVVRKGGSDVIFGLLAGLSNDSLILLTYQKRIAIPFNEIARVTIDSKTDDSSWGVYGILLGIYIGNFFAYRVENQSAYYLEKATGGAHIFTSFLFAGVGGGLGYFFGSALNKREIVFDFIGDDENCKSQWRRLCDFVSAKKSQKSINISIQSTQVHTRLSEKNAVNSFSQYYPEMSSFNLLRSIQVTLSVDDHWQVGGMVLWCGEPQILDYNYLLTPTRSISENFDATGYYLLAKYSYSFADLDNILSLNCGIGIGGAHIEYSLTIREEGWNPTTGTYSSIVSSKEVNGARGSSVFFAGADVFLYSGLSIGVTIDYVYIAGESFPSIPELSLKEHPMGNYSFGVSLGFHF